MTNQEYNNEVERYTVLKFQYANLDRDKSTYGFEKSAKLEALGLEIDEAWTNIVTYHRIQIKTGENN